jgi:hypothetical protein
MTNCSLVGGYQASEETAVSIFKTEVAGSRSLRNIAKHLHKYTTREN